MERLSENSNTQMLAFQLQDSNSTRITRWLSGKKLILILGLVFTIMLFFGICLIFIQEENQSLKMDLIQLKNERRMTFVRDCKHLRHHGITQSGKYFIDPDGHLEHSSSPYNAIFNKPPLQVFCNFEKNYTVIPYDEQDPSQMELLKESSGSCWQDLTFDCKALTYSMTGIPKGWWLDKNGRKQYFFNGAFENTSNFTNCQNDCKCIDNHGIIRSDWLLPITGFEHDQPGLEEITIGDLTCSDEFDLQITGKVRTSHFKSLRDWKGTIQIRFEFETHSETNLTRKTTKAKYHRTRQHEHHEDYDDYSNYNYDNSDDIIVNCKGFLRFKDFNIEYCSCSSNHNCKRGDAGYLKFTTNFYEFYTYNFAIKSINRASVQFPSFGLNEIQHVEVILDHTGVIKIKVNSQTKHLVDNRIDKNVEMSIQVKPNAIDAFATIMNVSITE